MAVSQGLPRHAAARAGRRPIPAATADSRRQMGFLTRPATKLSRQLLGAVASRALARVASASHVAFSALLTFMFPEWYERDQKYRPEQHYMRGPGPKWRAKRHM